MGVVSNYTMDNTYMVALPRGYREYPDNPERWTWTFELGEYETVGDITDWLEHSFGGGFAEPGMHQIVEVSRRVMEPEEYSR
jgi:hypothetical protein